ncbi:DNA alkylation repair protein [Citricoccus sp. NR2]|uniref:DNA alkylation repair protein n=1 Tax=Citricoccus sp. NR2 TaxID=3004095 RepID=UPI0022DE1ACC|nr:DNA alkylation repair protein [Citricoccus sp. NR2]WBL20095.1 DNA alkylation repair protein [Citricoccus sp. NR2]
MSTDHVAAPDHFVTQTRDELAALEDPKIRAVNERHGDDHGVNLTKLRAVAKNLKAEVKAHAATTDGATAATATATAAVHEVGLALWNTGETPLRLVALLIVRPRDFTADEFDAMLRESRAAKTTAWLTGYLVLKSAHIEELRTRWLAEPEHPEVYAAGWALTADTVVKHPDRLDLPGLLDTLEAEMTDADERPQWEMNSTLAMIGIHHESLRARALDIGERLEVLKDYSTPPNCTSPFAPEWITEMVRRQQ